MNLYYMTNRFKLKTIKFSLFALLICLAIGKASGQASMPFPENMTNLGFEAPTINPASPSVAAMMRFEEIPVNGYTGMPDINIPLFSSPTLSGKVKLDIALNYHASSIGAEEIAPFTGLGWSLMAGGSISRTVRGYADENVQTGGSFRGAKIGLYNRPANINDYSYNYYYQAESWTYNPNETYRYNRFKWDGYEKGMFDTEHDLYQFNFMGISGRFYLRMNAQNNLDVVRLDDNTQYKIEVDYTGPNFGSDLVFTFNKFTITDPNGIKYIFQDKEELINSSVSTWLIYFDDSLSNSGSNDTHYTSAYNLTEVRDENNNLLVKFNYTDVVEKTVNRQQTKNTVPSQTSLIDWAGGNVPNNTSYGFNMSNTEPKLSTTYTLNEYKTKKLSSIVIQNIGSVDFSYSASRTDTNLPSDNGARKLDEIQIKDKNGDLFKRFELEYDYFRVNGYVATNISNSNPNINYLDRLILTDVKEFGSDINSSTSLNYHLEYDKPYPNQTNVIKNPWGYFELNDHSLDAKKFTTTGSLKKMHVPTGGYIQFDFEPSTYSYIGDHKIEDFSGNPENTTIPANPDEIDFNTLIANPHAFAELEVLDNTNGNYVNFELYLNWVHYIGDNFVLTLQSDNGFSQQLTTSDAHIELEADQTTYFLRLVNHDGPSPGIDYSVKVNPSILAYGPPTVIGGKEFLYGGGVRIKDIRFFENENLTIPTTLKRYEYKEFDDTAGNTSSGSIAFREPVYEFVFSKRTARDQNGAIVPSVLSYISKTNFNNLAYLKTHGADVGHKYVRILDVNPSNPSDLKGKTENIYISPREYTEFEEDEWEFELYSVSYPFIPSKNFDYRRGQLKNSKIYDQSGKLLKETTNEYEFANESIMTTGLKLSIINGGGCEYAYNYNNFSAYNTRYETCQDPNNNADCLKLCGFPASHIQIHPLQEAIGWTKLKQTITKDYYYDGNTPHVLISQQDYTYNNANKQVQTQTMVNSQDETLKVEYKYPQDLLAGYDQSGLMNTLVAKNILSPKVITKSFNNTTQLSESQTRYKDFGAGKVLPEFVYQKKGNTSFENKITYNRYDAYGNLEQYTMADGTTVAIVWGYNNQHPIAKVEGKTYAEIQTLASTLITNSNSASGLQPSHFENLRKVSGAVVTCYIYEPMVGVKTIIQPNGQKETYEYDEFGRLHQVLDNFGKVINQQDYHYKN